MLVRKSFLFDSCVYCFLQEWGVTRLTFEYDSEPFGKERDAAIVKLAKEAGVEVVIENSHTLYDLDRYGESKGNPRLGWDCHVWEDFSLFHYVDRYTLIAVILCEPRRCQQDYSARSHF